MDEILHHLRNDDSTKNSKKRSDFIPLVSSRGANGFRNHPQYEAEAEDHGDFLGIPQTIGGGGLGASLSVKGWELGDQTTLKSSLVKPFAQARWI